MRRRLAATLALAVLVGACTRADIELDAGPVRPSPSSGEVLSDPDEVAAAAMADVQDYWERRMEPVYGRRFEPLRGGLVPFGPGTSIPDCGDASLSYDDVADNALYCPVEDYVAWDRASLIPDLQRRFGPLTVGIVMAHEFAHAVQNRADVIADIVILELQADCFAGAWVADVEDRLPTFSTDGDALDRAAAGLLELRDAVGSGADAADAHGSGFDRIGAFQDGYEGGAERCATYEDDPPEVFAQTFRTRTDLESGGNLPTEELLDPLLADLESFFASALADLGTRWRPVRDLVLIDPATDEVRCGDEVVAGDDLTLAGFLCAPDRTAYVDGADLVPALEEIGDFALAGELARLWSLAALDDLGLGGDQNAARADCLTGAFAAAEIAEAVPDQQLLLSPGDLDEVVIAFLAFGTDDDAPGFERTATFRAGFVGGLAACDVG